MDQILEFFRQYGLVLTLIAVAGIMILGTLKYCNVFSKLEERSRHYCYIIISVGVSVIASIIYLACVKQLTFSLFVAVSGSIYALNQTFYNIFKVTSINDFFVKLLDWVKTLITKDSK